QRCPEAFDDVEYGFSPTFRAAALEASKADVVFVGAVLSIGEMGKFEGDDHAVEDHCRPQTGADGEEEHSAALVAAECLHGRVGDEAERLAEGLLKGEVYPSWREVVRVGEWAMIDDRAGVADGDAVVVPVLGGGENIFRHLLRSHFGTGRNLDGDAFVAGGDFDVGTANVDYEDFHL